MTPKVKVWVTFSDDMRRGGGPARLLPRIDERGSPRQAANQLQARVDRAVNAELGRSFGSVTAARRARRTDG